MKKFLFSVAILATSFAFGQITLEHSFPSSETVFAYTNGGEMFYVSKTSDNKLKIYHADYSLNKIINVPIPANYKLLFGGYDYDGTPFPISKNIFNMDNKYEFMIEAYYYDNATSTNHTKLLLINEDGQLLKDFHPNDGVVNYGEKYMIFHDAIVNKNKLIVSNWLNGNSMDQFDIYLLPTSALTLKEIQTNGKLTAFPIPTKSTLKIQNPNNNSNIVEVFDTTGKLVLTKNFSKNEDLIILNVENLMKGLYFYKVGELSAKFIKE